MLTGGGYLHLGKTTPPQMQACAKEAMALFGSTSPSYLILSSLDRCNRYLAEGYREKLADRVRLLDALRNRLRSRGWQAENTDPLRLTVTAPEGMTGTKLADLLRENGMECEYADPESLVLMITPENDPADLSRLEAVLGTAPRPAAAPDPLPLARAEQVLSIRQALFAPHESVPAEQALGRICGAPTVSCPPAIPIAVSGERIGPEALALFRHYGTERVDVLCQSGNCP